MNNEQITLTPSPTPESVKTYNPSMIDVNDSDKKLGALHIAKLLLDGYMQLYLLSMKKINKNEKRTNYTYT